MSWGCPYLQEATCTMTGKVCKNYDDEEEDYTECDDYIEQNNDEEEE